jgi:hypothetical protein
MRNHIYLLTTDRLHCLLINAFLTDVAPQCHELPRRPLQQRPAPGEPLFKEAKLKVLNPLRNVDLVLAERPERLSLARIPEPCLRLGERSTSRTKINWTALFT